jgi:hypothetical protein
VAQIRTAAAVHDVGKINTPREILMKPGRLTDAEFSVIQRHAPEGAAMAAGIGDEAITAMVCHHHERLDGSGYPQGLSGDAVPLGARIIAVADVFDAMTSSRPYRPARAHKRAMEILSEEAGTKLDARAVAAFRSCYSARRSVAWSALLVAAPQRLAAWAGGAAGSGGVAPLTTGLSALGAAALLGGSVMGPVALGEDQSRRASSARPSAPEASEGASRRAGPERPAAAGRRATGTAPRSRLRSPPGPSGGKGGGETYTGPTADPAPQVLASPAPAATPSPQRPSPPRPRPVTPPAAPQVEVPRLDPTQPAPLPQLDEVVHGLVDGVGKSVSGLP